MIPEEGWHLDLFAGEFPLDLPHCDLDLFPRPTLALSSIFHYCILPLGCIQRGFWNIPKEQQAVLLTRQVEKAQILLNGTLSPLHPPQPHLSFSTEVPSTTDRLNSSFWVYSKINHSIYLSPAISIILRSLLMTKLRPLQSAWRVKSCSSSYHNCKAFSPFRLTAAASRKILLCPVVLGTCGVGRLERCCLGLSEMLWHQFTGSLLNPAWLPFILTYGFFSLFLLLKSNSVNEGFNSFWANFKCQSCMSWCLGKGVQDVSPLTSLA